MPPKICIIGAGSAVFSLNLIKDLALCENLAGSTVTLMDIDEQRLTAIHRLCTRYTAEQGTRLRVERTSDRREALRGADFVLHVALDHGHDRLKQGWDVAFNHGYRFGGSLHIVHDEAFWVNFHQLRLMESVLLDMLELSPSAYFITVANPVLAGVTYLSRKYPSARIVGMCHGFNQVFRLAKQLGLDPKDISYELPGVNHFIWLTKLFHRGEDALPLLDRWLTEQGESFAASCPLSSGHGAKAQELYRLYGAFPIGDTCTPGGGSWGWWYHSDDREQSRWREDPREWYAGHFRRSEEQVRRIHEVALDETVRASDVFSAIPSQEPMVPLIEGVACDAGNVVIVNVKNDRNYVPGVPRDFAVEIPALCSNKGIQGIATDGLPRPLLSWLWRDRLSPVDMELEAFETGNRDLLLSLILMDPWTRSRDQAEKLLSDILAMPCNHAMGEHYR